MTIRAGGARAHAVVFVAGVATETFMNPQWRAVVAASDLPSCIGRMALVAESLPRVGADLHVPIPLTHRGQRQIGERDGLHLPPVEDRYGRPRQFLRRAGGGFFR